MSNIDKLLELIGDDELTKKIQALEPLPTYGSCSEKYNKEMEDDE